MLVTGASSGIGRTTAVLLSHLGAQVVLVGRNQVGLHETLGAMAGAGHHQAVFDLERVDYILPWLNELVRTTGLLDGLVCAAGISSLRPLRALDIAHFDKVMRINCSAAIALTTAFCRKRIRKSVASVVLVASVAGLRGIPSSAAYCASKGALIAFARSAGVELASAGMRVNCVAPGYVKTPMYDAAMQQLSPETVEEQVRMTQPLGLGTPLDVAHAIAFLLADTGRWITGSVLAVDGGYTAR